MRPVSTLFWYMGMIPDLATFRDRSKNKWRRMITASCRSGLDGLVAALDALRKGLRALAALATPLVLSRAHGRVALTLRSRSAGWHTTIFPPYFVAGAIFSGFRHGAHADDPGSGHVQLEGPDHDPALGEHVQDHPGHRHDGGLAYTPSSSSPGTAGVQYEKFAFMEPCLRSLLVGLLDDVHVQRDYAPAVLVQEGPHQYAWAMWSSDLRQHRDVVRAVRDHGHVALPRLLAVVWGTFADLVDIGMLVGSFGLFLTLFLLFCRYLPVVAMRDSGYTKHRCLHSVSQCMALTKR
jgi:hypothetical protein